MMIWRFLHEQKKSIQYNLVVITQTQNMSQVEDVLPTSSEMINKDHTDRGHASFTVIDKNRSHTQLAIINTQ